MTDTITAGRRIHVSGVVQGVGFRPFIYGLALRHTLTGWVRNTSAGVEIEVDGTPEALDAMLDRMKKIDEQAAASARRLADGLGVEPNLRGLVGALEKAEAAFHTGI